MLCVYYRLIDKEAAYLNKVIGGYDATRVIRTSYVDEVNRLIVNNQLVSIEGPKGCGKTFTCAQVYYELAQRSSCLFLSMKSFQCHFCWKCLMSIMSKDEEVCFSTAIWVKLFEDFPRPLYLFVDLSLISDDFDDNVFSVLLSTANALYNDCESRIVLSLSSGTRHILNSNNRKNTQLLSSLISYCEPIYLQGFTESEAKFYLNLFESRLEFDQLYRVTSTNPLLLRISLRQETVHDVELQIETMINAFLLSNFHIDASNSLTLRDYILKKEFSKCIDFAYLACHHGELNDKDEPIYKSTLLAKCHLTLVEEKIYGH